MTRRHTGGNAGRRPHIFPVMNDVSAVSPSSASNADRHLAWEDLYNARDLGGLPVAGGGTIRRGAVVRGDSPARLTARGWAQLWSYGIRTVIDLRDTAEVETEADGAPRPGGLSTVHCALEEPPDPGFWDRWPRGVDATPLYYAAFLDRFPERITRVLRAIADAPPGGVYLHCGAGRDRTGLVVTVLLTVAGVPAVDIADDYLLSTERLERAWRDLGAGDQTGRITRFLDEAGTSADRAITATVDGLDADGYLRANGFDAHRLAAIRWRLR